MESGPQIQNEINTPISGMEAEVIVKPENPLSNLPKPVLMAGLVLLLVTVASVSYYLGSNQPKEPMIKEATLPLPSSTLQNPLIYEWQGSVEGVLVEKNDQNFTLEKDGAKLTISIKKDYTAFYKQGATGSANLGIKDVPDGATVRGIIWLASKNKLALTGAVGDIVGGTFSFATPQKK